MNVFAPTSRAGLCGVYSPCAEGPGMASAIKVSDQQGSAHREEMTDHCLDRSERVRPASPARRPLEPWLDGLGGPHRAECPCSEKRSRMSCPGCVIQCR